MEKKEGEDLESYEKYLGKQFDSFFTNSLPVDAVKEFPFREKYIFGASIFGVFIASFLYFAVSGNNFWLGRSLPQAPSSNSYFMCSQVIIKRVTRDLFHLL